MLKLLDRRQVLLLLLLLLLLLVLLLVYHSVVVVLLRRCLVGISRSLRRRQRVLVWLVHLGQMVQLVLWPRLIRLELGRGLGLLLLLLLLL